MESRSKYIENENHLYVFDSLTSYFTQLVVQHKLPIKSDPKKIRTLFEKASEEKREYFIGRIQLYNNLLEIAACEKTQVMRDQQFIWRSLKEIKALPSTEIFETILPGDIVEVYDPMGVQIFANFNFCSLLSYTIEDLIWYSFDELFGREPHVTKALLNEFNHCFTKATGPFRPDIPEHLCWEISSEEKIRALVKMKQFCPIFGSNGKAKAMLATSRINILA